MKECSAEILLVEDDRELGEMIEQCLTGTPGTHVTHVGSASEALREELTTQHDLVITAAALPDLDGLALVQEIRRTNDCPMILLADAPTVDEAIAALRIGVSDLLVKPFELEDLTSAVRQLVDRENQRQEAERRYRRLRRLTSRIIRERRDLRQRMDLICRDFVHAYRRLAQKMADSGLIAHEFTNDAGQ